MNRLFAPAVALAGGASEGNAGLLSPQFLTVGHGPAVTLRAAGTGHVNLIDTTTHTSVFTGLATAGDDVVLDADAGVVKVRNRVVDNQLRPGDRVQITTGF